MHFCLYKLASTEGVSCSSCNTKPFAEDALGCRRGSGMVMPITTLEARLVSRDVKRGLCGFVLGSQSAGEEKVLHWGLPGVLTLH